MPIARFSRPGTFRRPWLRRLGTILLTLGLAALTLPSTTTAHQASDEPLRFGVFPYLPPLMLDRTLQPIVADLSSAIHRPVHLRTKDTFERFREALAEGSYDLILVHPFLYTFAAEHASYEPIAKLDQKLFAVLLAPPESGLSRLADLKGKVLGLPDALSAVSIMVKVALLEHDLRPERDVTLRHYETKPSCLHAAAVGTVDACALPDFVLQQLEIDDKLEPFYRTPPMPHLVLAAHPRVDQSECFDIRQTALDWSSTAAGRRMLAARGWRGFVPARDRDYRAVRAFEVQADRLMHRP